MTSNVWATSQLRGHFARSSAALIEDLGVAFDTARGHDPGEHRMRRAARLSALPQQRQIHAIGVMPVRPQPDRHTVDRLRHLGEQGPGILLHSVVARPEDVFNDKIGLRKVRRTGHVRHDSPRFTHVEGVVEQAPLQGCQVGDAGYFAAPARLRPPTEHP